MAITGYSILIYPYLDIMQNTQIPPAQKMCNGARKSRQPKILADNPDKPAQKMCNGARKMRQQKVSADDADKPAQKVCITGYPVGPYGPELPPKLPPYTEKPAIHYYDDVYDHFFDDEPYFKDDLPNYVEMNDLTKMYEIVKKGDLVVFDIDKTLMNVGSDKYVDGVMSLCPTMRDMVNVWLLSDIGVIILTARRHTFEEATTKQLKDIQMDGILVLHAPNDNHKSIKGITLESYIESLTVKPKRVVFADDMRKNHTDVKKHIKLPIIHILKIQGQIIECGTKIFPDDINGLAYIETLSGGNGGVYVYAPNFRNKTKTYVLKHSDNIDHMKNEILADALYKSLGVSVPDFAVYDHLPYNFRPKKFGPGPYRLSQYIQSAKCPNFRNFKDDFVADALMSNWDICVDNYKNVICSESGTLYRIDNGGALGYRALGKVKVENDEWTATQVTELETMKQSYPGLTQDDINAQIKRVISKRRDFFNVFDEINKKIGIYDAKTLKQNLVSRFEHLEELISYNDVYKKVGDNTSAGAFIFFRSNDEYLTFIGKRKGHEWWGNLGGKSDKYDQLLSQTASREIQEESLGLIVLTRNELEACEYFDLQVTHGSKTFYRMYFVEVPLFESLILTRKEIQKWDWVHEYTSYGFMKTSKIIKALNENTLTKCEGIDTLQVEDVIFHPPFYQMLTKTKSYLERILRGDSMKKRIVSNHYVHISKLCINKMILNAEIKKSTMSKQTISKRDICQTDLYMKSQFGIDSTTKSIEELCKHYVKHNSFVVSFENKVSIMCDIYKKELISKDYFVFYHTADDQICFFYKLITLFKKCINGNPHHQFRGLDLPFAPYKNVNEFMNAFKQTSGLIHNYSEKNGYNYADMGMSVNAFLFGNDGNDSSSSIYMFTTNISVSKPDNECVLEALGEVFDINLQYKNYYPIFENYMKDNPVLYQIFIPKKYVNDLVYVAVAGGDMVESNGSHSFEDMFGDFTAEHVNKWISSGRSNKHCSVTINGIQGRLFLKPELMNNKKIRINEYYGKDKFNERLFMEKLENQIMSDISMQLWENAFNGNIKRLNKLIADNLIGNIKYQIATQKKSNSLSIALRNSDIDGFKDIIAKTNVKFANNQIRIRTHRAQQTDKLTKHLHRTNNPVAFIEIALQHDMPLKAKSFHYLSQKLDSNEINEQLKLKITSLYATPEQKLYKYDQTQKRVLDKYGINLGRTATLTINSPIDKDSLPIIPSCDKLIIKNTHIDDSILQYVLKHGNAIRTYFMKVTYDEKIVALSFRVVYVDNSSIRNLCATKYFNEFKEHLRTSFVDSSITIRSDEPELLSAVVCNKTIKEINIETIGGHLDPTKIIGILSTVTHIKCVTVDQHIKIDDSFTSVLESNQELILKCKAIGLDVNKLYKFKDRVSFDMKSHITGETLCDALIDDMAKSKFDCNNYWNPTSMNFGNINMHLSLNSKRITDAAFEKLVDAIIQYKCQVDKITLLSNLLTDVSINSFVKLSKYNDKIDLDVRDNKMSFKYKLYKLSDTSPLQIFGNTELTEATKVIGELNIKHIDLTDQRFDLIILKEFIVQLPKCKNLETLNLSSTIGIHECYAEINQLLQSSKTLRQLFLRKVQMVDGFIDNIKDSLKDSSIDFLSLWHCGMNDKTLEQLCNNLPKGLRSLTISKNQITDAGIPHLINYLKGSNLEILKLGNNKSLTNAALDILDHLPQTMNTIKLEGNVIQINQRGILVLKDKLKASQPNLKYLFLTLGIGTTNVL